MPAMILTVRLGEKSKRVRFDGVTGEIKILTSLGTLMQEIVK